jgi:hypothetical protein
MKKAFYLFVLLVFLGLGLFACSYSPQDNELLLTYDDESGGITGKKNLESSAERKLYAGQNIDVGKVYISNDEWYLYITYGLSHDLVLLESHVAVADSLEGVPLTKKGNPIPGQFPYKLDHDPPVSEYTYAIDLMEIDVDIGDTIGIAAHAVVAKLDAHGYIIAEETAWGGCRDFPGKNWARYMVYIIEPYNSPKLSATASFPVAE